jgi:NAD(P)-dependent dehydrogenase (short-subunit alcohol dehydrogenase family)
MSMSMSGNVAIVTGGASGLGRGIVEKFVARGSAVVIADIHDDNGQDVAAQCGPSAWFRHADVSDAADVDSLVAAAVERFGGLDVMVNNAGISSAMHKSFLRDDLADFHRVMSVNVLGVMLGTRAAARHMATHGGGAIINIASIGGLQPGGGVMTYRASKAAVIHFSKSVATELAPPIGFGYGAHMCVGAPLARMETQAVLRELVDRVTRITAVGPTTWSTNSSLRGPTHLPVCCTAV